MHSPAKLEMFPVEIKMGRKFTINNYPRGEKMSQIEFIIESRVGMAVAAEVLGQPAQVVEGIKEHNDTTLFNWRVELISLSPEYAAKAVEMLKAIKEMEIARDRAEYERKVASGEIVPGSPFD